MDPDSIKIGAYIKGEDSLSSEQPSKVQTCDFRTISSQSMRDELLRTFPPRTLSVILSLSNKKLP